jgi:hypothetical protein
MVLAKNERTHTTSTPQERIKNNDHPESQDYETTNELQTQVQTRAELQNTETQLLTKKTNAELGTIKETLAGWLDDAVQAYRSRVENFFANLQDPTTNLESTNWENETQEDQEPHLSQRTEAFIHMRNNAFNQNCRHIWREALKSHYTKQWVDKEKVSSYSPQHKVGLLFLLESVGILRDTIPTLAQDIDNQDEYIAEMLNTRNDLQREIKELSARIEQRQKQGESFARWAKKTMILAEMLRTSPPTSYIQQQAWIYYLSNHHPTIMDILNRETPPQHRSMLLWSLSANKIHPDDIFLLEQYLKRDTSTLPVVNISANAPQNLPSSGSNKTDNPIDSNDELLQKIAVRIDTNTIEEATTTYAHLSNELDIIATQPRSTQTIDQRDATLTIAQEFYNKRWDIPLPQETKTLDDHRYAYAERAITEKSEGIQILYALQQIQDASRQLTLWTKYMQINQQENQTNPSWKALQVMHPEKILETLLCIDTQTMTLETLTTTIETWKPLLADAMWNPQNANIYQALQDQTWQNIGQEATTPLTKQQRKKYAQALNYTNNVRIPTINPKDQPERKEKTDAIIDEISPITIDKNKEIKDLPKWRDIFYTGIMAAYTVTMLEKTEDATTIDQLNIVADERVARQSICNQLPISPKSKKEINSLIAWIAYTLIAQYSILLLLEEKKLLPLDDNEIKQQTISPERQSMFDTMEKNIQKQWEPRSSLMTHKKNHQNIIQANEQNSWWKLASIGWILLSIRRLRKWRIKPGIKPGIKPWNKVVLLDAYKEGFRAGKKSRRRILPLLMASWVWAGAGAGITFALMKDRFFEVGWTSEKIEEGQNKEAEFHLSIIQADLKVNALPREKNMTEAFKHNFSILAKKFPPNSLAWRAREWIRDNMGKDLYQTQAYWELHFSYDLEDLTKKMSIQHIPWKWIEEYVRITVPPLTITSTILNFDARNEKWFFGRMGDWLGISPEAAWRLFGAMFELTKQEALLDAYYQWLLTQEIHKAEEQMKNIIHKKLLDKYNLSKEQVDIQYNNESLIFQTNFETFNKEWLPQEILKELEENNAKLKKLWTPSNDP